MIQVLALEPHPSHFYSEGASHEWIHDPLAGHLYMYTVSSRKRFESWWTLWRSEKQHVSTSRHLL